MNNNFDYSVRVKNGAGWRQFNRVRLMISVGQEYHEGGKLKAVVDWINRNPTIDEVHISVNDTLQRHNHYAQGLSKQQADAVAVSEGTLWIERHQEILSGVNVKAVTTRWNDWLTDPAYPTARSALDQYIMNNPDFETAINADANVHATRKANRGEPIPETQLSHSREYLQEELAVFAIQAKNLPAAEIYPGSNLLAAEYLLGKALPQAIAPLSSRYFTRIDFARVSPSPIAVQRLKMQHG